jgi:hypothetical protein
MRRGPGPRRCKHPLGSRYAYTMLSQYENATMATTATPTHSAGHNAPDSDSSMRWFLCIDATTSGFAAGGWH